MDAEIVARGPWAVRMETLYEEHAARVGQLAYLLTGQRELAEDLTQEAFARSFGRISLVRDPDAFGAYLRAAVVNLARKHWRRVAHERNYLASEKHRLQNEHYLQPDVAERHAMLAALTALPFEQRAALVLRFFEDLSERDAAAVLGCRPGTVKSRVSRGLQALRVDIRGDET